MKKGFTLIELLAVIVILAIIAVIAVPIVIDIIDEAKINSIKSSANMYLKATQLYISNAELNKVKIEPGTYPITEDGNICIGIIEYNKCNGEEIKIEVKGNKPNKGQIIIDEENIQLDYLQIDGYTYYKDNNEYILKKGQKQSIQTENGIITINSSIIDVLSNYKIYGNSYQETRDGKNLFKIFGREEDSSLTPGYNNTYVRAFGFDKYYVGLSYNNYYVKNKVQFEFEGDSVFVSNTISGYGIGYPIKVKSNTDYVLYRGDCEGDIRIGAYDKDGNFIETQKTINVDGILSFKTGENVEIITIILSPSTTNVLTEYKNIVLEEGTQITSYDKYGVMPSLEYPSVIESVGDLVTDDTDEHYDKYKITIKVVENGLLNNKENKYYIYLKEPLRCVNEVCDELDFETGKVIRKINQYIFTGTETFVRWANSVTDYSMGVYFSNNELLGTNEYSKFVNNILSTHFIWKYTVLNSKDDSVVGKMNANPNSSPPYIGFKVPYTTLEDWKNYLKEQYANGTPLIINYELVESEYEYENIILPKIDINKGESIVSVETNIKPSKFSIDYYK